PPSWQATVWDRPSSNTFASGIGLLPVEVQSLRRRVISCQHFADFGDGAIETVFYLARQAGKSTGFFFQLRDAGEHPIALRLQETELRLGIRTGLRARVPLFDSSLQLFERGREAR